MAQTKLNDALDDILDKFTPYEVVLEDVVLSLLVLVSLVIIITAFSMVGNVPPESQQVVNEIHAEYSSYGTFQRLTYAGEILYPFVFMLSLLVIAREAWKYRKMKQIHRGEQEIDHFFRKLTEKLSNLEIVVNRLLIIFLSLMTSVAVFFALAMIFIQSPDKILFWILEPSKTAAYSVKNWISMLALIILAREGWLIMKKKTK